MKQLADRIQGEVLIDSLSRTIYATDASVYQEIPEGVVVPKSKMDLVEIVDYANKNGKSIIIRAAGTSLAGQCVGNGIVVDTSKYFNRIYDLNLNEKSVWVEPGVIRDELNEFLKPHGLMFGPNTSTANRCMMGGMVGNNSCGSSSIKYGTTRDHVLALDVILSDGSEARFESKTTEEIHLKQTESTFESNIYTKTVGLLGTKNIQDEIRLHFPRPEVKRRNTAYAIDALIQNQPFNTEGTPMNLCQLLCGSEGTLALTTAIKLSLNLIPPKEKGLVCLHFDTIDKAMESVPEIMSFEPDMCELMDKVILDCTKSNRKQEKNRFFVKGDPAAILMVQFNEESKNALDTKIEKLRKRIEESGRSYALPILYNEQADMAYELRTAGLGLLANIPGDAKAVACIEDTAVRIEDLADYIQEFEELLASFGQKSVFYAHAGAGEIHLRPILNLKKQKDVDLFYEITLAVTKLVKKYNGSLSGEHGDGRVRAEFIPILIGEKNYETIRKIKQIWDPKNVFNPGKIVEPASMKSSLRYIPGKETSEPKTIFRYEQEGGLIRATEKCNGSGDCRKLNLSGGTMCPSYRATRDEKDSTRARANALRQFLSNPDNSEKAFDSEELKSVLDLCLSCKACASECPSNIDIAKMKAEFFYHYQKINGSSLRSKLFANISSINSISRPISILNNGLLQWKWSAKTIKSALRIAPARSFPKLRSQTFFQYYTKKFKQSDKHKYKKTVYVYCDEFTNYNDVEIGVKCLHLLDKLGYKVLMIQNPESGRAAFSKGFLDLAKKRAEQNVKLFSDLISKEVPLIGIEPSCILGFRDEYPQIVSEELKQIAEQLGPLALLIDEFLSKEIEHGNIQKEQFDQIHRRIAVHGHCHQKSLSSVDFTCHILAFPENNGVELIPSGCCGMAGSFGYEKEHYEISMKVGGQVLFPYINGLTDQHIICAPGTSCRHQIKDGTARNALHPVEVLWESLK